jgi:hypothetical protein
VAAIAGWLMFRGDLNLRFAEHRHVYIAVAAVVAGLSLLAPPLIIVRGLRKRNWRSALLQRVWA